MLLYPRNLKFRGYYGLVWTPQSHPPPLPQAKACVSRNCNTNACTKFKFDTTIDDLEWKNPIDFGDYQKNQNGGFCENDVKI